MYLYLIFGLLMAIISLSEHNHYHLAIHNNKFPFHQNQIAERIYHIPKTGDRKTELMIQLSLLSLRPSFN